MKNLSLLILLLFIASCNNDIDDNIEPEIIIPDPIVVSIFENDTIGGINIVLVGDAFDVSSKEARDLYEKEKKAEVDHLFDTEPFKTYKQYFNVYGVYTRDTLDVDEPDNSTVWKFARNALDNIHLICMSSHTILWDRNADGIGETEGYADGLIAYYRRTKSNIMIHETGHAFAGLGDEYIEVDSIATAPSNFNLTGLPNLDTTNDFSEINWKHFIGLEGYEHVGAFEGGARFYTYGVWKPEEKSIMLGNSNYFNSPSREAIVKRIYEIKKMEYTLDEFLENDVIEGNSITNENDSGRKNLSDQNFLNLTNCIVN